MRPWVVVSEGEHQTFHDQKAERATDDRRDDDEERGLSKKCEVERVHARFHDRGAREPTEERVRRRCGKSPPPREKIPNDRADQTRGDQRKRDDVWVDAFRDVACDVCREKSKTR